MPGFWEDQNFQDDVAQNDQQGIWSDQDYTSPENNIDQNWVGQMQDAREQQYEQQQQQNNFRPQVTANEDLPQPLFGLPKGATEFPIAGFFVNPKTYQWKHEDEIQKEYQPYERGRGVKIGDWKVPFESPFIGGLLESTMGKDPFDPSKNIVDDPNALTRMGKGVLNALGQTFNTIGAPLAGYAGLGVQKLTEPFIDQKDEFSDTGSRWERALERAGVDSIQNLGDVAEVGRALSAETPGIVQFVLPMIFDPLTYVDTGFIAAEKAGLRRLATQPLSEMSTMERILTSLNTKHWLPDLAEGEIANASQLGIKEAGLGEKLNPFAHTTRSKAIEFVDTTMNNLYGRSADLTSEQLVQVARMMKQSAKDGAIVDGFKQDFPELAKQMTSYEGQRAIRALENIDEEVLQGIIRAKDEAARLLQSGGVFSEDAFKKLPDALQVAVKNLTNSDSEIFKQIQSGAVDISKVLDDAAKGQMLVDVANKVGEYGRGMFGLKRDENFAVKLRNSVKSFEANIFLGLNPPALVQNWLNNNLMTRAFGLESNAGEAMKMWKAWGYDAMPDIMKAATGKSEFLAGLGESTEKKSWNPIMRIWADAEAKKHQKAVMVGTFNAYKEAMRQLVNTGTPLQKQVVRELTRINPRLPEIVKGMVAAGYTKEQVAASLTKGLRLTTDGYVDEVARTLGYRPETVRAMLSQEPELVAAIDRALSTSKTVEQFQEKMAPVIRQWTREVKSTIKPSVSAYTDEKIIKVRLQNIEGRLKTKPPQVVKQELETEARALGEQLQSVVKPQAEEQLTAQQISARIAELSEEFDKKLSPEREQQLYNEMEIYQKRLAELNAEPPKPEEPLAKIEPEQVPVDKGRVQELVDEGKSPAAAKQQAVEEAKATPKEETAPEVSKETPEVSKETPQETPEAKPEAKPTEEAKPAESVKPAEEVQPEVKPIEEPVTPAEPIDLNDIKSKVPADVVAGLYDDGFTDEMIQRAFTPPPEMTEKALTFDDKVRQLTQSAMTLGYDEGRGTLGKRFMNSVNAQLGLTGKDRINDIHKLSNQELDFLLDGFNQRLEDRAAELGFTRVENVGRRAYAEQLYRYAKNLSPEQADAVMQVNDAIGRAWAKRNNATLDDYYETFFGGFRIGTPGKEENPLKQNLVVQHNLQQNSLVHADKLGGLALPSIAISDARKPLENFGDVTLIGDKGLIDPSIKSNRVVNADMYSPRYPRQEIVPNSKKVAEVWDKAISAYEELTGKSLNQKDLWWAEDAVKEGVRGVENDDRFAALFLKEKGYQLQPGENVMQVVRTQFADEFAQFAEDVVDRVADKSRFFKGYTYNGDRMYRNYTLDNIVRQMKSQMKEGEGFNYGSGSVRAKAAQKFRSIKDIQKQEGKLVTAKEMDAIKEDFNKRLIQLADDARNSYRHSRDSLHYTDSFAEAVAEAAQKGNIGQTMREWGWDLSDEDIANIRKYLSDLRDAPTEYFEAKPQRAVGLQEFQTAVIPSNASQKTKDILAKHGLDYVTYDPNVKGDRARVIEQVSREKNLLFQGDERIKGAVTNIEDSQRMMIWLTGQHDVSTLLHEPAHVWRRTLEPEDRAIIENWVKTQIPDFPGWFDEIAPLYDVMDGADKRSGAGRVLLEQKELSRQGEELFARAMERYFADGVAPTPELKSVFEKFRDWLVEIYHALVDGKVKWQGKPLDTEISPEVRDVMNRMMDEKAWLGKADKEAMLRDANKELYLGEFANQQVSDTALKKLFTKDGDFVDVWYNKVTGETRWHGNTSPFSNFKASLKAPDKSGEWALRPLNEAGHAGAMVVENLTENEYLPKHLLNGESTLDDVKRLYDSMKNVRQGAGDLTDTYLEKANATRKAKKEVADGLTQTDAGARPDFGTPKKKPQGDLFDQAGIGASPLETGTPQRVEASPFKPQEQAKQASMFGAPEMKGAKVSKEFDLADLGSGWTKETQPGVTIFKSDHTPSVEEIQKLTANDFKPRTVKEWVKESKKPVSNDQMALFQKAINDLGEAIKPNPQAPLMDAQEMKASRYEPVLKFLNALNDRVGRDMTILNADHQLPPDTMGLLNKWLDKEVYPGMSDARVYAGRIGRMQERRALLNYASRTNFDDWLSWAMPFAHFPRATATNVLGEVLNRPALLTTYIRARQEMDKMQEEQGFPARFKGKVPIPNPLLSIAPWMGDHLYFDPIADLLPVDRLRQAFNQMTMGGMTDQDVANEIQARVQRGEIAPDVAEMAVRNKDAIWNQVRSEIASRYDPDAMDTASMFTSFHFPLDWAHKALTGRPEDITTLIPLNRQIKGGSAILKQAFPNLPLPQGGADIEGAIREKLGLPKGNPMENYHIDRMLVSMAMDGSITERQARQALLERKGIAYDAAKQRTAVELGIAPVTSLLGAYSVRGMANGETLRMQTREKLGQLVDSEVRNLGYDPASMSNTEKWDALRKYGKTGAGSEIQKFYDANPGYSAASALYKLQDQRLQDWLVGEFWDKWNSLTALDKRRFSKENPDAQEILSKPDTGTRDYKKIPIYDLEKYVTLLRGFVPDAVGTVNAPKKPTGIVPFQPSNPNDSAAYDEWKREYSKIAKTQEEYYRLKESDGDYRGYLGQHPELSEYWKFNAEWKKEHPKLAETLWGKQENTTQVVTPNPKGSGGSGGGRAPSGSANAARNGFVPSTPTKAPTSGNWNKFINSIDDPELRDLLGQYFAQTDAWKAFFASSRPKLLAWLRGKDANYLKQLAQDYYNAQKAKSPFASSGNNGRYASRS